MAKRCKPHYAAGGRVLDTPPTGYGMAFAAGGRVLEGDYSNVGMVPDNSGGAAGRNLLERMQNDTVSAQMTPGEYVLTPEAVQMMGGPGRLDAINQAATGIPAGPVYSQPGMRFAAGGAVPYQDEYGRWIVNPELPEYNPSRYWNPTQADFDWANRVVQGNIQGTGDVAALYGTGQLSPEVQARMLANPYTGAIGQNWSEGVGNWLSAMRSPTYADLQSKTDPVSQYFYANPAQWGQYINRWGAPGGDKQPGGVFSYSPEEFYSALTGQPAGQRFLQEQSASAQAARHPGPNMGWMVPLGLAAGVFGTQALGLGAEAGAAGAAGAEAATAFPVASAGAPEVLGTFNPALGVWEPYAAGVATAFPVAAAGQPQVLGMLNPATGTWGAGTWGAGAGMTHGIGMGAEGLLPYSQFAPVTEGAIASAPIAATAESQAGTPLLANAAAPTTPTAPTASATNLGAGMTHGIGMGAEGLAPYSEFASGSAWDNLGSWLGSKIKGLATPDKLFELGTQFALGQFAEAGVPDFKNPYTDDSLAALKSASASLQKTADLSNEFMQGQQRRYEENVPQIQRQGTSLATFASDPYRWAQSSVNDFTRNAGTRRQQLHNALLSQGYAPGSASYQQVMRGFDSSISSGRVGAYNTGLSTGLQQGMNAQTQAAGLFPQPNYSMGLNAAQGMSSLASGYNQLGNSALTAEMMKYNAANNAANTMARLLTSPKEEADKQKIVKPVSGSGIGYGSALKP